jgi:hypothetical protein
MIGLMRRGSEDVWALEADNQVGRATDSECSGEDLVFR